MGILIVFPHTSIYKTWTWPVVRRFSRDLAKGGNLAETLN